MVFGEAADLESVETMNMPGATTSGFAAPSRAGPRELKAEMEPKLDHAGTSLSD